MQIAPLAVAIILTALILWALITKPERYAKHKKTGEWGKVVGEYRGDIIISFKTDMLRGAYSEFIFTNKNGEPL